MGAVVVILALLALAGLIALAWKSWQPPGGFAAVKLGHANPTLASPAEAPAEPGFTIQTPTDPGFSIVSVSHGSRITTPKNPCYKRPTAAANGFEFVGVTENLTAICKLTGRQAAICTCDRHKGRS